jgi:hypothetical protein
VIGAREHFGGYTLALGTTAYAVIHHVACPVLIAREHVAREHGRHRITEPEERAENEERAGNGEETP